MPGTTISQKEDHMAGKDKLNKLIRYVDNLKNRLSEPAPTKRPVNLECYRRFLQREIDSHSKKIDDLRMSEPAKK